MAELPGLNAALAEELLHAGVARSAVAIGQHLGAVLSKRQLEEMQAELEVRGLRQNDETPKAQRSRDEILLTPPDRVMAPLKRRAEAQPETPQSFQPEALPQKRRRDVLERALEFPKAQKQRSSGLFTAPRGSLFGSISAERTNSSLRRPGAFPRT